MRTIGLIGGMSWESTLLYYRIVNETVRDRLGGLHSARVMLASVDFHEIEELQRLGDWERAGALLARCAESLQAAGAENLVLCTNTMHKVASSIEAGVSIPLLHIADPTAKAILSTGFRTVGLLGTRFTMEQDFYRQRLEQRGLQVLTPELQDRDTVHRVIYEELCLGQILEPSRVQYRQVIERLVGRGAEAIILGCTEITLLVSAVDSPVPLFDTTLLHARAAAEWSIRTKE
ncbi:MAG: aspartate/glutamate racemase family protein [Povalibacter sp.]